MLLFSQFRHIKKSFISKIKIWNWFCRILYMWKWLLIIPFWSLSQKLWGVLVCGQLWILYSKINFEVIYLIQFSIFLEKNKIIGCRLFITTLQPLRLKFFPHLLKPVYYKIPWLHVPQFFFLKFGAYTRNGSFGTILVKT